MTRTEVENLLGFDPYYTLDRFEKAAKERAKLKAEIEFKKQSIKVALANSIENLRTDGTSQNRLESMAYASKEYGDFLKSYHEDLSAFEALDAEYQSVKARFEFEQNMITLEKSKLYFDRG